jgi:hypothetical protein
VFDISTRSPHNFNDMNERPDIEEFREAYLEMIEEEHPTEVQCRARPAHLPTGYGYTQYEPEQQTPPKKIRTNRKTKKR